MPTKTTTFATNDILTANDLNSLAGGWNAYTPALGGFTAGNGTAAGAYLQFGKLVIFRASFTFGSTSAAATTSPTLTLPVTATGLSYGGILLATFHDASASTSYSAFARTQLATGTVAASISGTNGIMTSCTTTTPFTWAVGDKVEIFGVYEAA